MNPTDPNNQNNTPQPTPHPQPTAQAPQTMPPQPFTQTYAPPQQPNITFPQQSQSSVSSPVKKPIFILAMAGSGILLIIIGRIVTASDDNGGSDLAVTSMDLLGDLLNFIGFALIFIAAIKLKKYKARTK